MKSYWICVPQWDGKHFSEFQSSNSDSSCDAVEKYIYERDDEHDLLGNFKGIDVLVKDTKDSEKIEKFTVTAEAEVTYTVYPTTKEPK